MTQTSTPRTGHGDGPESQSTLRELLSRITPLEIVVGVVIAVVMLALILIEPNILEAPFQNGWTLLFTLGGTALAAVAFGVMLWFRVPPVIRVIVLVVPFIVVNWWLLSPYFVDDVVDEEFSTSISEQLDTTEDAETDTNEAAVAGEEPSTEGEASAEGEASTEEGASAESSEEDETSGSEDSATDEPTSEDEASTPPPSGPVLLGTGEFVGLAGHSGTGDAAIFENPDGSLILRFENFDIENGPDLEVYLVPGAEQTSLPEGSIHLGPLKGNIGDQNYELPAGTELDLSTYTALVWCEAFSVEFVGATIDI